MTATTRVPRGNRIPTHRAWTVKSSHEPIRRRRVPRSYAGPARTKRDDASLGKGVPVSKRQGPSSRLSRSMRYWCAGVWVWLKTAQVENGSLPSRAP